MDMYELIYDDILQVPQLQKQGVLDTLDFEGVAHPSYDEDELEFIVNELDNAMRETDNHRYDLRCRLLWSLTGNSSEVKPSQVKLLGNAAEEERRVKKELIDPVFKQFFEQKDDYYSPLGNAVLDAEGLTLHSIQEILDDRLEGQGRKRKKRDSNYVLAQKRSKMASGFVQFVDYSGSGPVDFSGANLGPKGRRVAISGRSKYLPSGVEKVIRKVSEYVAKEHWLLEEDRAGLKPLGDYAKKNDSNAVKVLFSWPEVFCHQANQQLIMNAVRSYARDKGHQHNVEVMVSDPKYKRGGVPVDNNLDEMGTYDTMYVDILCPERRELQAELQVTDALNFSILQMVSQYSHKLHKERLKRGIAEEFFKQDEWQRAMRYKNEQEQKSYDSFKNDVGECASRVYNFLIDRFEHFYSALQEYHAKNDAQMPQFLQYDAHHYLVKQGQ